MARCMQGFEAPALAFDDVAIGQQDIRSEGEIGPRLARIAHRSMRAKAHCRCARRCLQRRCRGRMVGMGMCHEDVGDGLARQRGQQGIDMGRQQGARIDDRHIAAADNVGSGTHEGEGPRILRHDPADQWRHRLEAPIAELEIAIVEHEPAYHCRAGRGQPGACRLACR